jgi:beta-glucanase (GH16 family)
MRVADTAEYAMTGQIDLTGYKLTFADEFNTFDRRLVGSSTGTWGTSFGEGVVRSLNDEKEIYVEPEFKGTSSQALGINPFSVKNGILTITAEPVKPEHDPYIDKPYTSGMITTQATYSQLYGYFEMRADLPEGTGLWPAFWTLFHQTSGAEFDIVEAYGVNPGNVFQTAHQPNGPTQGFKVPTDWTNGFHTYGLNWTKDTLTFYVDGVATASMANTVHTPAYLIANLAIEGRPDRVADPSSFPAEMKIDYIRAYEALPPGTTPPVNPPVEPDPTPPQDPDPIPNPPPTPETPPPELVHLPVSGAPVVFRTGIWGSDTLIGTNRNDKIDGKRGIDTMIGKRGDDTYVVSSHHDKVVEQAGQGIDTAQLYASDYRMAANLENLTIKTSAATKVWDNLSNNLMTAGTGANTFNFLTANGHDVIKNFALGSDHIHIAVPTDQAHGFIVDGNLVLDLPGDNSIALMGVGSLSAMGEIFV